MNKPKPDQRVLDAIARLKNNPDFQAFKAHQLAMLEYTKHQLVFSQPPATANLQGRVMEQLDFFDLFK